MNKETALYILKTVYPNIKNPTNMIEQALNVLITTLEVQEVVENEVSIS